MQFTMEATDSDQLNQGGLSSTVGPNNANTASLRNVVSETSCTQNVGSNTPGEREGAAHVVQARLFPPRVRESAVGQLEDRTCVASHSHQISGGRERELDCRSCQRIVGLGLGFLRDEGGKGSGVVDKLKKVSAPRSRRPVGVRSHLLVFIMNDIRGNIVQESGEGASVFNVFDEIELTHPES